jgi:hypothetical protein
VRAGPGVKGGLHDISHGAGGPGAHDRIVEYFCGLFSRFVAQLAAVDEGDGNLLDHSLVHFSSSMRDGGHGASDIPQLLVGGACGRHRGARVVEAPKDTPVGELNLGAMRLLGLEIDRFGDATRGLTL